MPTVVAPMNARFNECCGIARNARSIQTVSHLIVSSGRSFPNPFQQDLKRHMQDNGGVLGVPFTKDAEEPRIPLLEENGATQAEE